MKAKKPKEVKQFVWGLTALALAPGLPHGWCPVGQGGRVTVTLMTLSRRWVAFTLSPKGQGRFH